MAGRGRGGPVKVGRDSPPAAPEAKRQRVDSGGAAPPVPQPRGRGARVKREINMDDVVHTKPDGLAKKQGAFDEKNDRRVDLVTNFFPLKHKGFSVMQYSIIYKSEIDLHDQIGRKRYLISQLKDDLPEKRLFGGDVMYAAVKLPKELVKTAYLDCKDNDEKIPVEVTIKMVKVVEPTDPGYIQALNHINDENLRSLKLKASGRGHYDTDQKREFRNHNLEIWPGISSTIRWHEHELMLRVELTNKVVRKDTAYDTLRELRNPDDCKKQLLGAMVVTPYNNKTYRIDDIIFDKSPATATFEYNGNTTTLADYYRRRYNQQIRDPRQPLLVSMPKKRDVRAGRAHPSWLVPELCWMTGLTDRHRSNYHVMRDLAVCLKMGPSDKLQTIERYGQKFYEANKKENVLTKWGMEVDATPVRVPARVLGPERVFLGRHGCRAVSYKSPQVSDWSHEVRNGMVTPTNLRNWYVLLPQRNRHEVKEFFDCMARIATSLGLNIEQGPKFVEMPDTRPHTLVHHLRDVVNKAPFFVVTVFQNQQADLYKAVKSELLVRHGVPNQVLTRKCMTRDRSGRMKLAVVTKVAVQMACKLGAIPWKVTVDMKDTMVVGFDTFHNKRKKSIGALVASYDASWAEYYSDTCRHDDDNDVTAFMGQMFTNALRHYEKANRKMPKRVLFYRDGVGEGQVQHVFGSEVGKLREVIGAIPDAASRPKLTVTIVSKRIAPRFFKDDGRGVSNPIPGTVIDDIVTLPERFDFFLVSQSVTEGTVNPTSFNVVLDENKMPPERHQRLAFKLCHLYPNWSGTIRVPAPCQLAHKLAFLLGEHELDNPHPHLRPTLFCL